jgi:hypothetical protein
VLGAVSGFDAARSFAPSIWLQHFSLAISAPIKVEIEAICSPEVENVDMEESERRAFAHDSS